MSAATNVDKVSMTDSLKSAFRNILSSSVKETLKGISWLTDYITSEECLEKNLSTIVNCLIETLPRYNDKKSRNSVIALIIHLHEQKLDSVLPLFCESLTKFRDRLITASSYYRGLSATALATLRWTVVILRFTAINEAYRKHSLALIEVQCDLYILAKAGNYGVIAQASEKCLVQTWIKNSAIRELFTSVFSEIEINSSKLCLATLFLNYLYSNKLRNPSLQAKLLDSYVKQVLNSRVPVPPPYFPTYGGLLKTVTHDQFKGLILPATLKAILRNPEIILECLAFLISGVSIDLSSYLSTIVTHLSPQLVSKSEATRCQAVNAFEKLPVQCSDAEAVKKSSDHLFSVLAGESGKLNLPEHKQSVALAVGHLSNSAVSGTATLQHLSSSVVEMFLSPLQLETHDIVLVTYIEALTRWCLRLFDSVPEKLMSWFKKCLTLKTSTSPVRTAYIRCMAVAVSGDRIAQSTELEGCLLAVIAKVTNFIGQPHLIGETFPAMLILLRLSTFNENSDKQMESFWNITLQTPLMSTLNKKYLMQASTEVFRDILTFSYEILFYHSHRLSASSMEIFQKILIFGATHRGLVVRRAAQKHIQSLISIMGGYEVAVDFISVFSKMIFDEEIVCHERGDDIDTDRLPLPRHLADALLIMSQVDLVADGKGQEVALQSLLPSHHPYLMITGRVVWGEVLNQVGLGGKSLNGPQVDKFLEKISLCTHLQCWKDSISAVVSKAPEITVSKLLGQIQVDLDSKQYLNVTPEHYTIFMTPEGQLYNRAVLDNLAKEDVEKNIKRESKAYSYADQLADIELRKELQKKQNKNTKPELNQKQKEIMAQELEKEATIRESVRKLQQRLRKCCHTIEAIVKGSERTACDNISSFIDLLLPLLNCEVAAQLSSDALVLLCQTSFQSFTTLSIGKPLGICTLRHLKPACDVDKDWSQEDLLHQTRRCLAVVTGHTLGRNTDRRNFLPTSCFSFLNILLKIILSSTNKSYLQLHEVTLDLMTHHSYIRSSSSNYSKQNDPAFLPIHDMINTSMSCIQVFTGELKHKAERCAIEICVCASGAPGCATASMKDITLLLGYLLSPSLALKETALQCLYELRDAFPKKTSYKDWFLLMRRLFVSSNDEVSEVAALANRILDACEVKNTFALSATDVPLTDLNKEEGWCLDMCTGLIADIVHCEEKVRVAACATQLKFVEKYPLIINKVVQSLLKEYDSKAHIRPAQLDEFKRVIRKASEDQWQSRCGIALAIKKLSYLIPPDMITPLFEFFISRSLGDRNDTVRTMMRDAAMMLLNDHGEDNVTDLLPYFESKFERLSAKSSSSEYVKQSVVILIGMCAKYLEKDSPKVKPIVHKLIKGLNTPSQAIQEAIASCLPALVPSIESESRDLINDLLHQLVDSDVVAERRGAAYGVACLVKGLGLRSLKQLDLMKSLYDAVSDKKVAKKREGALFAFEQLCLILGKAFEPYVVQLVPHLLLSFGDSNNLVRQAADNTAKAVMSKLSAHGVKLLLPSLLEALDEDSWRTKCGSVELLGSMAYCAPKQLSACLPSIVPKLMEVMADSHQLVQKSGAEALKMIGSVIRNPEIQEIVGVLLDALQDPSKKTNSCLQTLLSTKFVHFIDPASLALIMPILERSFQDRSTETRKMTAQIIGNMYNLTDEKDLAPYLPTVIPGLKQSLLDPVPDVRTVSARALGVMALGIDESKFSELFKWLLTKLTSESGTVDRSGAAQGLCEVVGGMGLEKLKTIMPTIIQVTERDDIAPNIRDGYIMTYIYLPLVFRDSFIPYVGKILPSILKGLSDECEYVRETALYAGQRIISIYSDQAIEFLMPKLESGLFDDNWRIRQSSVQLLGDLLYKISGVSGKMSTETAHDDDNFGTERSQQTLMEVLGEEQCYRVLSGLYIGRCDVYSTVRQSALHVWKIIVNNTPKTLRTILPVLFELLIRCLASTSSDKRQIAAKTLGDLVTKLGERILPEIIPILEKGLDSQESEKRQGVCIGLSEIMASTDRDHVVVFADSLIPAVRRALIDPLTEVRTAAARTFDKLHSNIGQRALDDILPHLLHCLEKQHTSEFALDGLKQLVINKSHVVLPHLIPQLISEPVNIKALALLSSVAGDNISRHLSRILPALPLALSRVPDLDETCEEFEYCKVVVLSATNEAGVRSVVEELTTAASTKSRTQYPAVLLLHSFCQNSRADYSTYLGQIIHALIQLLARDDENILVAAWNCLNVITKKMESSSMQSYITPIRQAVKFASSDLKRQTLPGLCLAKKGIIPLLAIFREGLLNGSPETRESAATGLGELIRLSSKEALQPSVIHITGPLIRILGDRLTHQLKIVLLDTLTQLLAKVGVLLKAFLPQLQTTFFKALNDPQRTVRIRAGSALGQLMSISVKVDQLFTDIMTSIKNCDLKTSDPSPINSNRDTYLQALRVCLETAGSKLSDNLRRDISNLLLTMLGDVSEATRPVVSACLGVMCSCAPEDEFVATLLEPILEVDDTQPLSKRHGLSTALYVALKQCPERLCGPDSNDRLLSTVISHINSDRIPLSVSGLRSLGFLMKYQLHTNGSLSPELMPIIVKTMKRENNEIKQLLCQVITYVAQHEQFPISAFRLLIPVLVNATKEKNTVVKYNAEMALFILLQLGTSDDFYQEIAPTLDAGMQDSLKDVVQKSLKKLRNKPLTLEEIDDTLLS